MLFLLRSSIYVHVLEDSEDEDSVETKKKVAMKEQVFHEDQSKIGSTIYTT